MQLYLNAFYFTATLKYIEQAGPFFGVPGTIDIWIVVALFADVVYGRRKSSSLQHYVWRCFGLGFNRKNNCQ